MQWWIRGCHNAHAARMLSGICDAFSSVLNTRVFALWLRAMREVLTDGIVTLHRYRLADAPDLHAAALESVASVFPWMPWCHEGYSVDEAAHWAAACVESWDKGESLEFVIRTADGAHVGGGGINCLNAMHPFANLGYWVRSSQQGKGYATRATKLLAQFGLRDAGMQRIELMAAAGNAASLRVIEKSGAHREGILRNRLVLHGVPHDAVGFSFIPADLNGCLGDGDSV